MPLTRTLSEVLVGRLDDHQAVQLELLVLREALLDEGAAVGEGRQRGIGALDPIEVVDLPDPAGSAPVTFFSPLLTAALAANADDLGARTAATASPEAGWNGVKLSSETTT